MRITDALLLANGQQLKNRLAKAAMTEGLADKMGRPTESLLRLYERWSAGGAALLITGNVQVDRHHLERAGNVVIDQLPDEETRRRLKAFARAGKSGGSRIWMQLSHAGRQTPALINPHPKGPSAAAPPRYPFVQFGKPVTMTDAEIRGVVDRFVIAARAAEEAGFDGVQIHAAHGYLLSSFLSPLANRREDQWGGSLEGRARFLVTTVRRVRAELSASMAVSVKLNSADFQRGGFELEHSVEVAAWLDAEGIDLLEISGGNYEAPRMMGLDLGGASPAQRATRAREAYFLEFAPVIRRAVKRAALMVTGGFRSASGMNAALTDDGVAVIGLSRPLLVAPECPRDLLAGGADLPAPERHLRIGPGILSPQSRFGFIKSLNAVATMAWYYEQMERLGAGREVEKDGRILAALPRYLRRDATKRKALEPWLQGDAAAS